MTDDNPFNSNLKKKNLYYMSKNAHIARKMAFPTTSQQHTDATVYFIPQTLALIFPDK